MYKTAIYPGSFDPFTNGHLDIVKKASPLFDKVYILIGVNSTKQRSYDADKIKTAIEYALIDNNITNCEVCIFCGLTAQYTKDNNIRYMIRGLRNNMDYNYEENIAEVNKLINPELEYIYFRAKHAAVSSSMVKELAAYGQDISKYVPESVMKIINNT